MKSLLLFIIISFLLASCSHPQPGMVKVTSSKLDTTQIPKSIRFKGSLDTAVKFTDREGQHVIITSEDDTDEATDGGPRWNGVLVYAYCYTITGDKWHLVWKMQDAVTDCGEDVAGGYMPATFAVTDLNQDGKAEVWLMYSLACRGDVSPSDIKVILHEGGKKYAMRGASRVKVNATDYYGGDYKFDNNFKTGPEIFRQHAQELWEKNKNEGFDEQHPAGKFN